MICELEKDKKVWRCIHCRRTLPVKARRKCRATKAMKVGYILEGLIRTKLGIRSVGCDCPEWIAKMNTWGPAGCREHREEIVDRMIEQAKKRNWKRENKSLITNLSTRVVAATEWGLAYARTMCGELVDRAIHLAEEQDA